jgi:hypothetical protein
MLLFASTSKGTDSGVDYPAGELSSLSGSTIDTGGVSLKVCYTP